MTYRQWCVENLNGFVPRTTAFEDFSIAERFGKSAIVDTYERMFEDFKGNYKLMTELCLVLNHKIWFNFQDNEEIARIYNSLWEKVDSWCCENLKGEEADYFFHTTD